MFRLLARVLYSTCAGSAADLSVEKLQEVDLSEEQVSDSHSRLV
jgi:hypothetical protein